MQKRRRRYPTAKPEIRFLPGSGGLALHDGQGLRASPLSFTAALVLTYCDGRHAPDSIAETVAGLAGSRSDAEQLREDVHRIIADFASEGIVD